MYIWYRTLNYNLVVLYIIIAFRFNVLHLRLESDQYPPLNWPFKTFMGAVNYHLGLWYAFERCKVGLTRFCVVQYMRTVYVLLATSICLSDRNIVNTMTAYIFEYKCNYLVLPASLQDFIVSCPYTFQTLARALTHAHE